MTVLVEPVRRTTCTCGAIRTEFPLCTCGHRSYSHDIGVRAGVKVRTACARTDADGPCGCRMFQEVADVD